MRLNEVHVQILYNCSIVGLKMQICTRLKQLDFRYSHKLCHFLKVPVLKSLNRIERELEN